MLHPDDVYPLSGAVLIALGVAIVLRPSAVYRYSPQRIVRACVALVVGCVVTALAGAIVWWTSGSSFALGLAVAVALTGAGLVWTAVRAAASAPPRMPAIALLAALTLIATLSTSPEIAMAVRVASLCGVSVTIVVATLAESRRGLPGIRWVRAGGALYATYAVIRLSVGLVWGLNGVEASGVFSLTGSMIVLAAMAVTTLVGLVVMSRALDHQPAPPRVAHTLRHVYLRATATIERGARLIACTALIPDFAVIRAAHGMEHATLVSNALTDAVLRNTPVDAFAANPAQGIVVALVPASSVQDVEVREMQIVRDFAVLTPTVGVSEVPAVRVEGLEITSRARLDAWTSNLRRALRAQYRGAFAMARTPSIGQDASS